MPIEFGGSRFEDASHTTSGVDSEILDDPGVSPEVERIEQKPTLARIAEAISSPIGEKALWFIAACLIGAVAYDESNKHIGDGQSSEKILARFSNQLKESLSKPNNASEIVFSTERDKLKFVEWDRFDPKLAAKDDLSPDPLLRDLAVGNLPPEIQNQQLENPGKFTKMVLEYVDNPDNQRSIGLNPGHYTGAKVGAKELLVLCTGFANKYLEYNVDFLTQLNEYQKQYGPKTPLSEHNPSLESSRRYLTQTPIDRFIYDGSLHKSKVVCGQFATTVTKAWEAIAPYYSDSTKNIFVRDIVSDDHAWNAVTLMEGPNRAEVTFIDPTAAITGNRGELLGKMVDSGGEIGADGLALLRDAEIEQLNLQADTQEQPSK